MIKQLQLFVLSTLMMVFGMSASAQDAVTFNFDQADSYKQFGLAGNSNSDSSAGDILENVTATQGGTSITVTPNDGTPNRFWQSGEHFNLRLYGGKMIVTSDKNIAKIEFDNFKTGDIIPNTGSVAEKVWTAGETTNTVEFTFKKAGKNNTFINKMTITFGEGGGSNPDPEEPTETVAENIAAFKALCVKDGADVTLNLADAKVLYVNEYTDSKGNAKQEVFVKDATGSLMFYNAGLTVANGDVINGSIKGIAKDFYGTAEFCSNANTDVATLNIEAGSLAAGEAKPFNEITNDDISNLIIAEDAEMISKEETDSKGKTHTNYYLVDANGNELCIYNKFHVEGLDADSFVGQQNLNFIGIIKLDFGRLTLCPIDPVKTGIDCIENVELDVNAPMYNVAGQKVNNNYKGIVLQNGKKFFNK